MKSNWEIRPLGELVRFSSGGTPSKKHPEYWNGTIPWISAKSMKDERISTSDLMITEAGLASGSKLAPTGSLLLLTRGSGLFNGIPLCIVERQVAFNQDVKCIESCSDVSNQFIFYWLKSQEQYLKAKLEVTGIGAGKFDTKFLQELNVLVPPKEERDKIVAIAEAISKKIIVNAKINDNLLEQLNALYQEFSTRDTWDIVAIGELAEKIAMGPFGSNIKVSTFVPDGVPIISGNHLRGYFLEEPGYNYITEEHSEKLKNSIVYPGDVIFTHAGNIGQVAMIPDGCDYPKYVLSQRQFYLRCNKEKLLPEYVTLFFHSKEGQHDLLSYANQTGVPSIAQPASNLKKIKLPVPPIHIQEEWAALVRPIITQHQRNRLESRALADLRDRLLPKLMSGEIDVSNIEL